MKYYYCWDSNNVFKACHNLNPAPYERPIVIYVYHIGEGWVESLYSYGELTRKKTVKEITEAEVFVYMLG